MAVVADIFEGLQNRVTFHAARIPDSDVVAADRSSLVALNLLLALRVRNVILKVGVHDPGLQARNGSLIVLVNEHPVGRFIDDSEVGAVDCTKCFEAPLYCFEEAREV